MKSTGLNKSWIKMLSLLNNNLIRTVVPSSKEEILISRLENKLGKSKDEVKKIISAGLMDVLVKVPFNSK